MNLVLASSSPRRYELLSLLDIPFTTISVDIDESILVDETPTAYIQRMVEQKAQAVINSQCLHSLISSRIANKSLILTADTIGVMPNGCDILVKPSDKADAFAMWQKMSNQLHYVWTAVQATVVVWDSSASLASNPSVIWQQRIVEKTAVSFIELTQADMERYWQTGEPLDKAGGYAIQGKAGAWVSAIEGSYSNVVGLPLAQTKQLIESALSL